jgi:ubiquinone/menaquinone biosynthesis C-methylase UbiE
VGIYRQDVLPWLINLSMQAKHVMAERARLVPVASGTVLDVGIGSGLNIPIYSQEIERLYGLDPSPTSLKMARRRAAQASFPVELIQGSGEDIPLDDKSVDTVVTTWSLCTIPNAVKALQEMRRVLKLDGQLVFVEHGRAVDPRLVAWQDRLTPLRSVVAALTFRAR